MSCTAPGRTQWCSFSLISMHGANSHAPRHSSVTKRSEEHTSELQSLRHLVCRLLLEKQKATVLGRRLRTSALLASMANGAQSHALDFDDTHLPSSVHGSAPVAPGGLALGEGQRATGA